MKFLLGLSLGIAAGLVFAPRSGVEVRRELRERAEELQRQAISTGREKAGELGRRAGERLFDRAVGERR
jgi:gas vesicle protein